MHLLKEVFNAGFPEFVILEISNMFCIHIFSKFLIKGNNCLIAS